MTLRPVICASALIGCIYAGTTNANVLINEVLGSTTSTDSEFIELFNAGDGPVDIGNWSVQLFDSDSGSAFGTLDGGSPYTVPSGVILQPGGYFLMANSLTESRFALTADLSIPNNGIENSSYTIVLADAADSPVNVIFVTDGGSNDAANIGGNLVMPELTIGPDGSFIPAGFSRSPDGSTDIILLEFNNVVPPSATPTPNSDDPPVEPDVVTIMAIQGAQHTSPLLGAQVTTTGVVTAVDDNGFYLQDPIGDADDATSDALFVFTSSSPGVSVGNELEVTGTVSEFFPGGQGTGNLSTTQLSNPQIIVTNASVSLPSPVLLGASGRALPSESIDDDAFAAFEPDSDGIDFFESLEAMRVQVVQPLVIAPTNRFGEIFTVADMGTGATGISSRNTLNISETDFNPERIQIDEDTGILPGFSLPEVAAGAMLSDVLGVISYGFGNFEVLPTQSFSVSAMSQTQPESSNLTGDADTLSIASYNVLNLDPNDSDGDSDIANGRFDAIAAHIVTNLNAPDIVALQEIQDNNGSNGGAQVAADVTLQTLVNAISTAGGPTYAFADTPGLVPDSVGGQPGGNIRVAFLYNTARVTLSGSVVPLTDPADQATNPNNPFFGSRISLAADFLFNDEVITVINNHLSSKGGSSPIMGVEQPFEQRQEDVAVNGSLDERQAQAGAVRDFVANVLLLNDNVIVLGDMNEFEFVSPVDDLLGAQLTNLVDGVDDVERYSFVFQGNSQQLDHVLVSDALLADAQFDIVHVNAEFPETDMRASDHEPLLALVTPGAEVVTCNGLTPTVFIANGDRPTSGDDVILGTPGDDRIFSRGGNDTICALGGNDMINTSSGDDWVDAGEGDDEIITGRGDDEVYGGAGVDRISAGPDADYIEGQDGDDVINGGSGDDLISGGDGADNINGGSGGDIIEGGVGDDTILGFSGDDEISGGEGDDDLRGNTGNDVVSGDAGSDTLRGGLGNDELDGGADLRDRCFGNAGLDVATPECEVVTNASIEEPPIPETTANVN